jgi:hypothetical protein
MEGVNIEEAVNSVPPYKRQFIHRTPNPTFKKYPTNLKKVKKFIAVIEDSEGNLYVDEDIDDPNQADKSGLYDHAGKKAKDPTVSAVGSGLKSHDYADVDYVPSSFLG